MINKLKSILEKNYPPKTSLRDTLNAQIIIPLFVNHSENVQCAS
jgi:hypothetical protein